MAVPVLFALEDGSTTWLTLHNSIDSDGDLVVADIEDLEFGRLVDLLTAVMKMRHPNTLYRAFAGDRPRYIVRLEDNSILTNTGRFFLPSRWLTINSENVLTFKNSPIIFKPLTELEYTFM